MAHVKCLYHQQQAHISTRPPTTCYAEREVPAIPPPAQTSWCCRCHPAAPQGTTEHKTCVGHGPDNGPGAMTPGASRTPAELDLSHRQPNAHRHTRRDCDCTGAGCSFRHKAYCNKGRCQHKRGIKQTRLTIPDLRRLRRTLSSKSPQRGTISMSQSLMPIVEEPDPDRSHLSQTTVSIKRTNYLYSDRGKRKHGYSN